MITPELQNYVAQSRASGMTDEQIHSALTTQGWSEEDISQALGGNAASKNLPFTFGQFLGFICLLLNLLIISIPFTFSYIESSNYSSVSLLVSMYGISGAPLLVALVGFLLGIFAFRSKFAKWFLSIVSIIAAFVYIRLVVMVLGGA